jgi:prepilin-type N-terminal cleavage/methylation domain-containing protein
MDMKQRGFTLIELLVVIAIIGILSAVVLASLNTAREQGEDATIQSELASMRSEAELFYTNNSNSYDDVCSESMSGATPNELYDSVEDSAVNANCDADSDGWAAEAELSSGDWFCVNYEGVGTTTSDTSGLNAATDGALACDGDDTSP